jgi:hypothetical protein
MRRRAAFVAIVFHCRPPLTRRRAGRSASPPLSAGRMSGSATSSPSSTTAKSSRARSKAQSRKSARRAPTCSVRSPAKTRRSRSTRKSTPRRSTARSARRCMPFRRTHSRRRGSTRCCTPSPRLRGEGRGEGRGDWPLAAPPLILAFSPLCGYGIHTSDLPSAITYPSSMAAKRRQPSAMVLGPGGL